MKKILAILLISLCVFPVWAQRRGPAPKSSHKPTTHTSIKHKVKQKARPSKRKSSPKDYRVRILNFQDHPFVTIRTTEHKPLRANLLEPDILRNIVFSDGQVYIPQSFVEEDAALYRGMKLSEISDLENLLVNGLETKKSHYVGEIFTSPSVNIATNYALPVLWDTWKGESQMDLPVLLRIPVTSSLLQTNPPDQFGFQWIFRKDVAAEHISDVVVFLNINNTPGWYKAVLENNHVIFMPVPGIKIPIHDGW